MQNSPYALHLCLSTVLWWQSSLLWHHIDLCSISNLFCSLQEVLQYTLLFCVYCINSSQFILFSTLCFWHHSYLERKSVDNLLFFFFKLVFVMILLINLSANLFLIFLFIILYFYFMFVILSYHENSFFELTFYSE